MGGEWIGQFELPGGRKLTLVRTYQWSFDQRLLIGRSFGEVDGRRRQSREAHYFWNPATQRIEFHDFLDQGGGYGAGVIELRGGAIHMSESSATRAIRTGAPASPSSATTRSSRSRR